MACFCVILAPASGGAMREVATHSTEAAPCVSLRLFRVRRDRCSAARHCLVCGRLSGDAAITLARSDRRTARSSSLSCVATLRFACRSFLPPGWWLARPFWAVASKHRPLDGRRAGLKTSTRLKGLQPLLPRASRAGAARTRVTRLVSASTISIRQPLASCIRQIADHAEPCRR